MRCLLLSRCYPPRFLYPCGTEAGQASMHMHGRHQFTCMGDINAHAVVQQMGAKLLVPPYFNLCPSQRGRTQTGNKRHPVESP